MADRSDCGPSGIRIRAVGRKLCTYIRTNNANTQRQETIDEQFRQMDGDDITISTMYGT